MSSLILSVALLACWFRPECSTCHDAFIYVALSISLAAIRIVAPSVCCIPSFAFKACSDVIFGLLYVSVFYPMYYVMYQSHRGVQRLCELLKRHQNRRALHSWRRHLKLEPFEKSASMELGDEPACIICFEDFEAHQKVCKLPCSHVYHPECIFTWLERNPVCPMCKRGVVTMHSQSLESRPDANTVDDPELAAAVALSRADVQQHQREEEEAAEGGGDHSSDRIVTEQSMENLITQDEASEFILDLTMDEEALEATTDANVVIDVCREDDA